MNNNERFSAETFKLNTLKRMALREQILALEKRLLSLKYRTNEDRTKKRI